jgi:hypothetical protein
MRISIMSAAALLLLHLSSTARADTQCYSAESVPDGMSYHVRNGIVAPDHAIRFVSFTTPDGQSLEGTAKVTSRNVNGTIVKGVELTRIAVRHDATASPATVVIQFADFGGGVNLRINGVAVVAAHFGQLNGRQIGGATVLVQETAPGPARVGTLRLTGPLASFTVGGQSVLLQQACSTR